MGDHTHDDKQQQITTELLQVPSPDNQTLDCHNLKPQGGKRDFRENKQDGLQASRRDNDGF